MKRVFGIALLALPLLVVSAQAEGPVNSGRILFYSNFSLTFQNNAFPQAGPWYLYWPLEGHFVAPAPTGYPYWPPPQGLPQVAFGGPVTPGCPPGYSPAYAAPAYAPALATPAPASVVPRPAAPTAPLQPTAYNPLSMTGQSSNFYPATLFGQPPSYWYDR